MLSAEATRERTGVGALRHELTVLQADVAAAQARLADTQARVEQELERVNALRQEAVSGAAKIRPAWGHEVP